LPIIDCHKREDAKTVPDCAIGRSACTHLPKSGLMHRDCDEWHNIRWQAVVCALLSRGKTGSYERIDQGRNLVSNCLFLLSRRVIVAAGVLLSAVFPLAAQDAQMVEDGQPVTVRGFLKGCNSDSGMGMCDVEGEDGYPYSVILDEQTPADARDTLLSTGPNNKVVVDGTMVAHGDVSLNISVSKVKVITLDPKSPEYQQSQLSGLWKSTEDDQSTMRFSGAEYFDYYSGDAVDQGQISFPQTCADSAPGGNGPFLVKTSSDGSEYCYAIDSLTADTLTLMYLPRGNILSYTIVTEEEQYLQQQ
jgi:hypothetical protein